MDLSDLIGSAEAATMLGRSQRTIHRLVISGALVPVMTVPGGHVGIPLFLRADVEALAAERKSA